MKNNWNILKINVISKHMFKLKAALLVTQVIRVTQQTGNYNERSHTATSRSL
jgi:hypothetical protein